jgi:hypothetical protein
MGYTGLYGPYSSSNVEVLVPGLINAWLSEKADFATLNEPVIGMSPVLGDAYTITNSHAWTSGKEAIKLFVNPDTLEAPGESAGSIFANRLIFRPKLFILGDGANILEMTNNWLNKEIICFVQDDCNLGFYWQFGCDCKPAIVEKVAFATGTVLGTQAKGYELTIRGLCKFKYTGQIDERTA